MRKFLKDKELKGSRFVNRLELFVILMLVWIVFSAIFEAKFLFLGILTCLILSLYCLNAMYLNGIKTNNVYFILNADILKFLSYFIWLLKEVFISAVSVAKVILFSRKSIDPHIIWFKADYDNPAARALLANSITLTPGTITVDIYDDGVFSVHALTDAAANGLLTGNMQTRIADLYGENIDYSVVKTINYGTTTPIPLRLRNGTFKKKRGMR